VSTRPVLLACRPTEREMMGAMKSELKACPWRWRTASAAPAIFALLLAGSVQLCLARPLSQTTFPSPEDASRALFAAVQRHDERAVTEILGRGLSSSALMTSPGHTRP